MDARDWDSFDSYLFDIDGTLLNCRDAVHYSAFLECLRDISGREITLAGVPVHGSTDPKIIADALRLSGLPEESWRPFIPAALKSIARNVRANRAQIQADVLPGVQRVLEYTRDEGKLLGVATGNLEAIGWLKLEACGLRDFFSFGGFSDECESRSQTFRHAYAKARELRGQDASVCVIGDTPADILASRENGLPVIAVATGIFPFQELLACQPDLCIHSLEELLPDLGEAAAVGS